MASRLIYLCRQIAFSPSISLPGLNQLAISVGLYIDSG